MKLGIVLNIIRQNFTLLLIGFILLVLILITGVYFTQSKTHRDWMQPKAKQGVFDFTGINLQEQTFVPLIGEVEFYWEYLLSPVDFEDKENGLTPSYLSIPAPWNNLQVNGAKVGAKGFGTYHFYILVPNPGMYCIKVKEFESAFQLWINSTYYKGAGEVGRTKEQMKPSWKRKEFYFYTDTNSVEFILQIANFHHRQGGASEAILFGAAEPLRELKLSRVNIESILMGVLLVLLLYHFTLYHYRREDKAILYFSITCFIFLLRLSTTGEKLLLELLPFISWEVAVRIEYIALVLISPALLTFFYYMLPQSIPKWFRKIINTIALVFAGVILFMPASIFTYTAIISVLLMYVSSTVLLVLLIIAAIQKKRNAAGLLFGYVFLCTFAINDLLVYTNSIHSSFLSPFGLMILLFTQAYIISRNNSLAFVQVEKLTKKLESHAEELEDIVLKRTKVLQEQKNEIEIQKGKIEDQASLLSETNEQLLDLDKFKKDMTRMMVHDLKNPLTNIIGITEMPEITESLKALMHESGRDMQNLIQNILDVTKYEHATLDVNRDDVQLCLIADDAYKQNRYVIDKRSIRFENCIPKDLFIKIDAELIERVMVNIISNATKYKNENGLIRVSCDKVEKSGISYCKVKIFNTGESIPADKMGVIFDSYTQLQPQRGEYRYSTGIGLTFCRMAIEAHQGEIGVHSKENEGVTFWFTIPYL